MRPGRQTRSVDYEQYSPGPSKKVRTAVGRSIFADGGTGRITKASPERESQQIAAPGEGKRKTRKAKPTGFRSAPAVWSEPGRPARSEAGGPCANRSIGPAGAPRLRPLSTGEHKRIWIGSMNNQEALSRVITTTVAWESALTPGVTIGKTVRPCHERSFKKAEPFSGMQIDLRISSMVELFIALFSVSIFLAHVVEAYHAQ
jgi:hypothetical protein